MSAEHYQLYATDSILERDRFGRAIVLFLYLMISFLLPLIGWRVFYDWFGNGTFGVFVGLILQIITLSKTLDRFIVKVDALRAFVTVDQLRTFLGGKSTDEGDKQVYVSYGPGLHVSYPWESRSANYNVSLEEASESFSVTVQTAKGTLTAKGSIRLRPDIRFLVPFIGGVAAMAGDITDIIKSFVIEIVSQREGSIVEILKSSAAFNEEINKKFGFGGTEAKDSKVSEFEDRFGVSVGDITISELLPSAELQKTMTGVSEAEIISNGAALLLGYTNIKAARTAISKGQLGQDDLNRARDRFMAASDNIKMNLDANEYTIKVEGLDPETIKALAQVAPAFMAATNRDRQGKKGK